ncbi:serpin family protein [Pontiellaceae bacterium B1224]|nr:serpin family protein [Pontiellaceae bacterium B1224]
MYSTAKQFIFLGMMIATSVASAIDNKPNSGSTAVAFDPAESINQLAIDLYKQTARQEGNLFLSPYSISTAFAMVYGGARGETAEQVNRTLHFGGQGATHPAFSHLRKQLNAAHQGQIQINIANSLWFQNDYAFLPDYLEMTTTYYKSAIGSVDFRNKTERARLHINHWVEDQTKDKIQDLLEEGAINSQTRLVLANAIYFKGNWASQFKKGATHPAPFTLKPGETINVQMMKQTEDFKLAHEKSFQALELPYDGGALSMIVLLPAEVNGLPMLEKKLSAMWIANLKFIEQEVEVQLPRFKFERKLELSDALANMGMPLAFSGQADFSGMEESKNLYIGTAIHQTFIEVNEEGTEAAGATAIAMRAYNAPTPFTVNHPFLFLIRENSTGTILFIGRVIDPTR